MEKGMFSPNLPPRVALEKRGEGRKKELYKEGGRKKDKKQGTSLLRVADPNCLSCPAPSATA